MMRRLFPHPLLSFMLFIGWLLLANSANLNNLILATLLAILVPLATQPWWPGRPRIHSMRLIGYVIFVLGDILCANVEIAAIILFMPARKIASVWITVPVDLPDPEAMALLAATITLTPGTLTAEFSTDNKALLVHVLHTRNPDAVRDAIKSRYESRLKRIFM
ncbi:Na+/H+ antiporter subunit E [Cypionkella sp.]|uniref:Na+/H+ antiporter subunit E n=1 Tax=Cypionkella sp. TaxID=2811411 RepID=UPI00260A4EBB|nr:Na+/H+ antiporter subunit E [Cypionkella sp.]